MWNGKVNRGYPYARGPHSSQRTTGGVRQGGNYGPANSRIGHPSAPATPYGLGRYGNNGAAPRRMGHPNTPYRHDRRPTSESHPSQVSSFQRNGRAETFDRYGPRDTTHMGPLRKGSHMAGITAYVTVPHVLQSYEDGQPNGGGATARAWRFQRPDDDHNSQGYRGESKLRKNAQTKQTSLVDIAAGQPMNPFPGNFLATYPITGWTCSRYAQEIARHAQRDMTPEELYKAMVAYEAQLAKFALLDCQAGKNAYSWTCTFRFANDLVEPLHHPNRNYDVRDNPQADGTWDTDVLPLDKMVEWKIAKTGPEQTLLLLISHHRAAQDMRDARPRMVPLTIIDWNTMLELWANIRTLVAGNKQFWLLPDLNEMQLIVHSGTFPEGTPLRQRVKDDDDLPRRTDFWEVLEAAKFLELFMRKFMASTGRFYRAAPFLTELGWKAAILEGALGYFGKRPATTIRYLLWHFAGHYKTRYSKRLPKAWNILVDAIQTMLHKELMGGRKVSHTNTQ